MTPHTATTLTMATVIEDHAHKRPNQTAIIYNDRRFTMGSSMQWLT